MSRFSEFVRREATPLTPGDCLLVFDRRKDHFDFPVHYHPEYELNFIAHAANAQRIVGDHEQTIEDWELVLVGPDVPHCWVQGACVGKDIHEITIQFHRDLFHESLLSRNVMRPVKELLARSVCGIAFSGETVRTLRPKLESMAQLQGLDSWLALVSLLSDLSSSPNQQVLSSPGIREANLLFGAKMQKVNEYIQQNFQRKLPVKEVADILVMSEVSFSRFIKLRTGQTFVEYLNTLRIGFATRYLIEDHLSVSEVAYRCGFNNLANFNRIFKKIKRCTPSEFRTIFPGIKRVN